MDAETQRLVQRARRCARAVDDRLAEALRMQALQRECAHGGAEAEAAELFAHADRLELAGAVLGVGPPEAVCGEAAVRRLGDAAECTEVRHLGANLRVAR